MLCLGDIACNLAGVFVFFAGDLARIGFRAVFGFGRAGLVNFFQRGVSGSALSGWPPAGTGVVAAELFQFAALRADVLIVGSVSFAVSPGPCVIVAP